MIYTTPRAGILEGITRDSLVTLARDLGFDVVEENRFRVISSISAMKFLCVERRLRSSRCARLTSA